MDWDRRLSRLSVRQRWPRGWRMASHEFSREWRRGNVKRFCLIVFFKKKYAFFLFFLGSCHYQQWSRSIWSRQAAKGSRQQIEIRCQSTTRCRRGVCWRVCSWRAWRPVCSWRRSGPGATTTTSSNSCSNSAERNGFFFFFLLFSIKKFLKWFFICFFFCSSYLPQPPFHELALLLRRDGLKLSDVSQVS